MHSIPDVESQLVALLRWLSKEPSAATVTVLVKGDPYEVRKEFRAVVGPYIDEINIRKLNSFRGVWAFWRAKTVLFTHILYGTKPKLAPGQVIVNLWHGTAVKAIWRCDEAYKCKPWTAPVPVCNYLLATSKVISEVLHVASGLPLANIPALGLPRNDLLFQKNPNAAAVRNSLLKDQKKLILYMPTFRETKLEFRPSMDGCAMPNALHMSDLEIEKLDRLLVRCNASMLVKPHPASIHHGLDFSLTERIQILSDKWMHEKGVVLYDILREVDLLITDLSSVYVDFLPLRRPIAFFFPDFERYKATRGFMLEPIEEWLPAPICETVDELLQEIEAGLSEQKILSKRHDHLIQALNPQTSSSACYKLFEMLRDSPT